MATDPALAEYSPPSMYSPTSGHEPQSIQLKGVYHAPGEAGWWYEDQVFGGSIEGLLEVSI